jgi:hypothetical protein
MGALIHFRCIAAEHQRLTASDQRTPISPVTYHDGRWAYCPVGFHEGHTWTPIEPSALDEVKQGLKSEVRVPESST